MRERGFITIATGDKRYYKIAANLLLSYKHFSKNPLPFAIIAEEENEYTKLFDDVIISKDVTRSFLDKFLLLKLCPYNETIFFDADSLAYGDLNQYWDIFKDATDFSSIGDNLTKEQEDKSWYDIKDIGEYGKKIDYIVRVHTGVCYIRKSDTLLKLYDDCMDIVKNYNSIKVRLSPWCTDEAVYDIAMPMNNMLAVPEVTDLMGYVPCLENYNVDIYTGTCNYTTIYGKHSDAGSLIHWSNVLTRTAKYKIEVLKLKVLLKKRSTLCIKFQDEIFKYYEVQIKISNSIKRLFRKIKIKLQLIFKNAKKK